MVPVISIPECMRETAVPGIGIWWVVFVVITRLLVSKVSFDHWHAPTASLTVTFLTECPTWKLGHCRVPLHHLTPLRVAFFHFRVTLITFCLIGNERLDPDTPLHQVVVWLWPGLALTKPTGTRTGWQWQFPPCAQISYSWQGFLHRESIVQPLHIFIAESLSDPHILVSLSESHLKSLEP